MVLPTGTTIPPLPYLLVVLAGVGAVGWTLYQRRPRITDVTVLALTPWMVAGAAAYVTYQLELVPTVIEPFASSPTVYGTAAIGAGIVWMLADQYTTRPEPVLAGTGALLMVPPTLAAVLAADQFTAVVPVAALLAAVALTVVYTYLAHNYVQPLAITGFAGAVVVFGQALDALTTALGVAHLGYGEQTPISRLLIEATTNYPVPLLGAGWLFVLVKLTLAVGIVWLLAPTVERRPREGNLLLALVTAVGLGPGAHNFLLFTVTAA